MKYIKQLSLTIVSLLLFSGIFIGNKNLKVASKNSAIKPEKVIISGDEFITDLTTYDWVSNDYIYQLQNDVDFTGYDATTTTVNLNATVDNPYTIDGLGHTIANHDNIVGTVTADPGYATYTTMNQTNIDSNYIIQNASYVSFENIHFKSMPFIINSASNVTFENIYYSDVLIDQFYFNQDIEIGIFINQSENSTYKNIVFENIISSNLAFDNSSSPTLSFNISLIQDVVGDNSFDSIFIERFIFDSFFWTLNNTDELHDIIISMLIGDGELSTNLEIKNFYYQEIYFRNIFAFPKQAKKYQLIGNNLNGTVAIEDVLIDNTLESDYIGSNELYSINIIDSINSIDLSNVYVNQINTNLEISPNETSFETISNDVFLTEEFQKSLFDDVSFVYIENNFKPESVTEGIKITYNIFEKSSKFYKKTFTVDYKTIALFPYFDDYKIGVEDDKGNVLYSSELELDSTFDVSCKKWSDKYIYLENTQTQERDQVLFCLGDIWPIIWTIIIILLIIALIIILLILIKILRKRNQSKAINILNETLSSEIVLLNEGKIDKKTLEIHGIQLYDEDNHNDTYSDYDNSYDNFEDDYADNYQYEDDYADYFDDQSSENYEDDY